MKMIRMGVLAVLLGVPSAFATKFANQFTEFELPPQWQCTLEGAEWVCQSTNEAKKKDAIINRTPLVIRTSVDTDTGKCLRSAALNIPQRIRAISRVAVPRKRPKRTTASDLVFANPVRDKE